MVIGVAGPYSAITAAGREANLKRLNRAAAQLLKKGHVPVIGVNAALPVVQEAEEQDIYKSMMDISMAVINGCEALLFLAESPGANKERDLVLSKGLPVYYSLEEVPDASNNPG